MDNKLTLEQWHRKQAIDNFNATLDIIDKKDSTKEARETIATAHASFFHWSVIGTSLERARGKWQISKVYSLVGMEENALFHGRIHWICA